MDQLTDLSFDAMSDDDLEQLYQDIEALRIYQLHHKIESYFPDKGTDGSRYGVDQDGEALNPNGETWSRHLFPKHTGWFEATKDFYYFLIGGGNRTGKTTSTAFLITCHLTGVYPEWWTGRRFDKPVDIWAAGKDNRTVVDVLQNLYLGPIGQFGTGMIPYDKLDHSSLGDPKKASAGVGVVRVHHVSGGMSTLGFKTYDAGQMSFMGPAKDIIQLDEEPPQGVMTECIARLTTTNGLLLMSFTPLNGVTEMLTTFFGDGLNFCEGPIGTDKYVTLISQDEVAYLGEKARLRALAAYPEYERLARSKGIPALGSGVVYPINIDNTFIDGFPIPSSYKLVFAIDFGWEDPTAIVWAAIDPNTDNVYIFNEHYVSKGDVALHASAIKSVNNIMKMTIPGVADPSGGGTSIADGKHTADIYRDNFDVNFQSANNRIRPGIQQVLHLFTTGKLKIFNTCVNLKKELTYYRYEKGNLKGADHLCDSLRYCVVSGLNIAKSKDEYDEAKRDNNVRYQPPYRDPTDWSAF